MASWQAKHRDPLFDQTTQVALERRVKELVGAGLIVAGVLVATMLFSFNPDDPGVGTATDQPAQNLLGRVGAYIASALFMIVGHGSWMLAISGIVWGLRLMLHRGEDRLLRGVFTPIAMVVASLHASSMVPPPGWTQSFGLGGHLGDMLMGGMIGILPFSAAVGLKILALLTAAGAVAMAAFVLGFDRRELMGIGRFLATGLATAYDLAMTAVGHGASASVAAAREVRRRAEARRRRREAREPGADHRAGMPGALVIARPPPPRPLEQHDQRHERQDHQRDLRRPAGVLALEPGGEDAGVQGLDAEIADHAVVRDRLHHRDRGARDDRWPGQRQAHAAEQPPAPGAERARGLVGRGGLLEPGGAGQQVDIGVERGRQHHHRRLDRADAREPVVAGRGVAHRLAQRRLHRAGIVEEIG